MTHRGRILRDTNAGPGIVSLDGKQFSFTLETLWMSDIPPRPGMVVQASFDAQGSLTGLEAVPENQLAKEQAQQALSGARIQGSAIASKLRARFGAPLLLSVALLMVGWFFLDALSLQGPRLHFTFWQILGYAGDGQTLYTAFDRNTPAGSSIFNALAWLALAGPFLRFVWNDRRAALAASLPLLLMLVVVFEVRSALRDALEHAAGVYGRLADAHAYDTFIAQLNPSFDIGAYLSFAAALYLAWLGAREFLAALPALDKAETHVATTAASGTAQN